jgi:hypothetical protein
MGTRLTVAVVSPARAGRRVPLVLRAPTALTVGLLVRSSRNSFNVGSAALCIFPILVYPTYRRSQVDEMVAQAWSNNFEGVLSNPLPKSVRKIEISPRPAALDGCVLERIHNR